MHEEWKLTRKELAILRALVYLYKEDYKLASTPGQETHLHEAEVLATKLRNKSDTYTDVTRDMVDCSW